MTENSCYWQQKAEQQKALFEKIAVGDVVDGVVKNVTDFGAFIDLGGADGLLAYLRDVLGKSRKPEEDLQSRRADQSSDQRYQRRLRSH